VQGTVGVDVVEIVEVVVVKSEVEVVLRASDDVNVVVALTLNDEVEVVVAAELVPREFE
jgi:hypothetical protein